ncbi:MAG: hypothetical protein ABEN55_21515, partial [Bradymonadaceae bacterium]
IGGCRKALGLEADADEPSAESPKTVEVQYDSSEIASQIGDMVEAAEEGDGEVGDDDSEATEASEVLEIDDASSMVVDVQD